ncbi:hypothetical protein ABW19_dt0201949 [Dactylella cylindrospora]|nr:hypothetical protein ABW19_dt0201949 [Dactylella cylindrospora]
MSPVLSTLSTLLTPFNLFSTSLPALVLSEASAFYPGSALFKLTASTAFVWRSLTAPNSFLVPSTPSFYITLSLACGWIGDFCLVPSRKSYYAPSGGHEGDSIWFKIGMLAFMLNHAGYIVAFLEDVSNFTPSSPEINWLTFGAVFAFGVILGDVADMPVPWRPHQGGPQSSSPRLPTIHSRTNSASLRDSKIGANLEDDEDIPSEPLTDSQSRSTLLGIVKTPKLKSSTPSSQKRSKFHARVDSGVTDLSISIPATPKDSKSNTPTATTPLLSPPKESLLSSILPKLVVPADMQPLIIIYQIIISAMVGAAAGTRGIGSARFFGAFAFMVSDVMVAWDTFGVKEEKSADQKKADGGKAGKPKREGWKSRSIGWMLYFGGQYLLAAYGAL